MKLIAQYLMKPKDSDIPPCQMEIFNCKASELSHVGFYELEDGGYAVGVEYISDADEGEWETADFALCACMDAGDLEDYFEFLEGNVDRILVDDILFWSNPRYDALGLQEFVRSQDQLTLEDAVRASDRTDDGDRSDRG